MIALYGDLHIHSCLSPCADDDMTPANICGMAMLKGLGMIALTDHNTGGNLAAMADCAREYGLLLIPGMEITTREEVHLLAYFADVSAAVAFGEYVKSHLPPRKNRPQYFGSQLLMDAQDTVLGQEDALLIGATDLPLSALVKEIRQAGGAPVPAHINRGTDGLLTNMGFIPPDLELPCVEVWAPLPCPAAAQEGRVILHSSDAHHLGDIAEMEWQYMLPEKSAQAFISAILAGTPVLTA